MAIEPPSLALHRRGIHGYFQVNSQQPAHIQAYDPESFRELGHQLIDRLADWLADSASGKSPQVLPYRSPDDLYAEWSEHLRSEAHDPLSFFETILNTSIRLHHPRYMGHQVAAVLPLAALADLVGSLMNNGVGVYEMGSPTVVLERLVVRYLTQQIGMGNSAEGVLTSGGTLGNLTALLSMRQRQTGGRSWEQGTTEQLSVLISEETHYSILRAIKILGWGDAGAVRVRVDSAGKLRQQALEEAMARAMDQGRRVIGVVANACTTALGKFDPLPEIADFRDQHDLWLHVDAAHGGGAIFSARHAAKLAGLHRADSVTIDFHKMLMLPALVTAVLFREGSDSYRTFAQNAHYLWNNESAEWHNLGKRTFECTKSMMGLKAYAVLCHGGPRIWGENVDALFAISQEFADLIRDQSHFELADQPEANIVCFRYCPVGQAGERMNDSQLNRLNDSIRQRLTEEGAFYIVQTTLRQRTYLRTALMNPMTTQADLTELLHRITALGTQLEQEVPHADAAET